MKLMIASDLHGSAYYTELLMAEAEREQPDKLLLLGDLLYHGPRNDLPRGYAPKRVIPMLNDKKDQILCVRGNCDAEVDQMVLEFPMMADYAALFFEGKTLYAIHGHRNMDLPLLPGTILLYGHTHIPEIRQDKGVTFVNPGSVSIPKNGSIRGYMLFDGRTITHRSLEGGETIPPFTFAE